MFLQECCFLFFVELFFRKESSRLGDENNYIVGQQESAPCTAELKRLNENQLELLYYLSKICETKYTYYTRI
jgi:hypothetical protein